jgi:hypothetical protein
MCELGAGPLRPRFNQAFFDKIYVEDDEVTGADLAAPFAQLLAFDFERRYRRETANSAPSSWGRSSNKTHLVEVGRLELQPASSSAAWWRLR